MTKRALEKLPPRIAESCRNAASLYGGRINEIRLRKGSPASLTIRGENIVLGISATEAELEESVRTFCESSLYSHADTVCAGYIAARGGFRVGVCGRAVVRGGEIQSVTDISSLNIRIPERVIGCADRAYEIMAEDDFSRGILVWSVPGMGKTTLLRELAARLATGKRARRVALVDTRYELSPGIEGIGIIDVLGGYPRAEGIEIAKRTLGAQVIICDEIADRDDAEAILQAHNSGICVAASAHASSAQPLMTEEPLAGLFRAGVFGTYYGLLAQDKGSFIADVRRIKKP